MRVAQLWSNNRKSQYKMKPQIVIHIGANKTGSSAIQSFIRANIDLLTTAGYLVPDSGLGLSNRITGEHVFALQRFINENDPNGLTAAVQDLVSKAEQKTLLLSAENLSNPGRHQFFAGAANQFAIRIILYIRRQDDMITSSWQQWQSKITDDFEAWLIPALQTIGHWDRLVKNWESIVGSGNVTVRIFERSEFPDGNIMLDFLDCLGIDHTDASVVFPKEDINPSFSDVITDLVAGNKLLFRDANDNEFFQMLLELTGRRYIEGKKVSLLSPKQREQIIRYYSAENEKLRAEFFPERDALFKPIEHSRYRYLNREQMDREQKQLLMSLIFSLWKKTKP